MEGKIHPGTLLSGEKAGTKSMYKSVQILLGIILTIGPVLCSYSQETTDSSLEPLKRFEIAGQFVLLLRTDADPGVEILRQQPGTSSDVHPAYTSEVGLGGRLGVNVTKSIGVEAEANIFPENKQRDKRIGVPITVFEPGGRKFQMLFGPKIGYRFRKLGVFGKVRPGFIRLDRFEAVDAVFSTPNGLAILSSTRNGLTFFNIDIGGVFEYYPSRRTILRFDAGDTIIRYGAQEPKDINPSITRHNLQISVGFGFRF